ncbi:pyruvate dehydrogenase E2 component (dihydrolipoamide acetyltransferase) [Krasilnikovia cinnamomea]|uniref:Dihydrolipoamide acetyltransferase component of pyruvate dehydrogenase complex n=1 Tax=Krasilnikovia cinnamomea TaxID=349313 RepID=A0A4Q7ZQV4_9ACTN|nr:dihydrolipoamide acetyltransferase family protein [Krasilnikovia cinnamomea]RZU53518.1 pyruvate dehydrogenase E2 component (dihydrolipoamide acetyltransferase) [Krasilnikovia cinnamomea]
MAEFRMPSLGADMTEGVLVEWLVSPGATVHRGDVVAVVDTAKAAIEVECFDTGTVEQLLVEPGARVPVGTPLATITVDESAAAAPAPPPRTPVHSPTQPPPSPDSSPVTSPLVRREAATRHVNVRTVHGTGTGGRVTRADIQHAAAAPARRRVSPRARRLAAEAGVDLTTVHPTGPRGSVTGADILGTARRTDTDRSAAMRRTIAALMARSKREIPHYYLTETIDLTDSLRWLRDRNRELPVPQRIVAAALLLKASAVAARAVPELNGFWQDDGFVPSTAVHLGVAVSLRGGGLVAPAIENADGLPLTELMARLKDLVARTRAGRLRGSELASPTLTVSNLGEQGVESIIGVIYPPQVALVGFGRITERPWAVDGLLGVRQLVTASLAGDHRATDGATGARYLREVARLLNRPEEL